LGSGSGGSGGSGARASDAGSSDGSGKAEGGADGAVTGDAGGATFTQVRSLLTMSCAVTGCHGNAGGTAQIDLRDTTGLYTRLMGQAPSTAPTNCKGKTLISPSMPMMSLLISMVDTNATARMGCGGRMPDGCPTPQRPCLTTPQIDLLKNWVTAGAPMQ